MIEAHRAAARVMQSAKRLLQDSMLQPEKLSQRHLRWMEQLQDADEQGLLEIHTEILRAIQDLRFLSAASRQPALQQVCERNIRDLTLIATSPEFRARCLMEPPEVDPELRMVAAEASLGAIQDVPSALPDVARTPETALAVSVAGIAEETSQQNRVPLDPSPEVDQRCTSAGQSVGEEQGEAERLRGRPGRVAPKLDPFAPPAPLSEDEERYYGILWMMIAPDNKLSGPDARVILGRSSLAPSAAAQVWALIDPGNDHLDQEGFTRYCRLVAHAQAGSEPLEAGAAQIPPALPEFAKARWDGYRLRVEVPLTQPLDL